VVGNKKKVHLEINRVSACIGVPRKSLLIQNSELENPNETIEKSFFFPFVVLKSFEEFSKKISFTRTALH